MSSKPEDRRPSQLQQLLRSCSPWHPPLELATQILNCWMPYFQWENCGLAWADMTSGLANVFVYEGRSESSPSLSFELTASAVEMNFSLAPGEDLSSLTETLRHRFPEMQWSDFSHGQDCQVTWGKTSDSHSEFDHDLITAGLQTMIWGLEFQRQLRLQKLSSLAEYAAGAGHEINNPLGSIIGRSSQLLKDEPDLERRRLLENIGAQAYRIRDMIGDTMLFARPPVPQKESIVLADLVSEVLGRLNSTIATQGIHVHVDLAHPAHVDADRTQLQIVFSELIRNSLHAMPGGGEIHIVGSHERTAFGGWYRIDFSDNGPSLTEEQLEHCFDPFFSGRQAGRGLGFGLSKCWQILRQHGGKIELLPEPAKTTLRMWWPISSRETAEREDIENRA